MKQHEIDKCNDSNKRCSQNNGNREDSCKQLFGSHLYIIEVFAWVLKIIPIPIALVSADLMASIVNNATQGRVNNVVYKSLILLAFVSVTKCIATAASIFFDERKAVSLHKCKLLLYKQFLSQPLYKLYDSEHGEAIEKLNDDFDSVTGIFLALRPDFYVGIITSAVYFVFLLVQSVPLAFLLLAISLLQLIPPAIVKNFMQINYEHTREIESELTNYVVASYNGFATIKLYVLKTWFLKRLANIHNRYMKIGNSSETACAAENAMNTLLESILKYGTYGIAGAMVLLRIASMETGVEAIALSGGFFAAVKAIFDTIPGFSVANVAKKRLDSWFAGDRTTDKAEKNPIEGMTASDNKIKLKDISFSYGENKVFENASVEISIDKITLIKGTNGIGKSTLFKHITGLVRAQRGKIKYAGIDFANIDEDEMLSKLFYVPQEDALFNLTPKELFEMIDSEKAEYCLRTAIELGLTEDMLIDAKIPELSGGERKKVFLSVALSLDKELLLLDEPTNSLDEHGRKEFMRMLKEKNSGAIIISHDSSISGIADQVYTLTEGEFVREGA